MAWEKVRLADCCKIKPPKSEAKQKLKETDLVSFVPMNNLGIDTPELILEEERALSKVAGSYTYFAENDVLLAKITPCFENGKLGIAKGLKNGIGFGSSEFIVFRTSDRMLSEYLYYYLLRPSFRDAGQSVMTGAVGHKRVPKDFIEETEIPLPSIPEQKRIVAILDQAFADIDKARALTEQNLKNARELFESYLQQLFSRRGEGWKEDVLSNICEVKDGTHDSPKYVDNGIPFVTQKNVRDDGLSFEKTKFICESDHENFYRRSDVSHGDILVSMIGANRGMACLVDDRRTFSIKNVGLIKNSSEIDMSFLLYYLKSGSAKAYVETESRGGAQPFIGLTKLRAFPVYYPALKYQEKCVELLSLIESHVKRLTYIYQQKLDFLEGLKNSLLQKAFSGELTRDSEEVAA